MSGKVTDYIDKYYNELHCNCAQTVFCSAVDAWELDVPGDAGKLLNGYGGGMCVGIVCGAVSGGCAALGCKSEDWDKDLERKTTRKKIQTFIRLIRERYGSENCAKLRPQFFSKEERCFQTIRRVASILDEVYEME